MNRNETKERRLRARIEEDAFLFPCIALVVVITVALRDKRFGDYIRGEEMKLNIYTSRIIKVHFQLLLYYCKLYNSISPKKSL